MKNPGVVVMLAVAGSFSGTLACGRTGVGIFDEVGADGGGHDGDVSAGDTDVADVASETPCPKAGGSDAPPPPSCTSSGEGTTNCGLGGSGSESCCTSPEVCGGTYYRTYTNDGGGPTGEADLGTVSDFRLDKYLVTAGRFRQFVASWRGGYYPPAGSGIHTYLNDGQGLANSGAGGGYETGWDATDWNNTTDIDPTDANLGSCSPFSTWTSGAAGNENMPINCVTWYEAYAFCIWDGGFLPSAAELEYAAAGGSQQREYPWGSITPGTACPGTGCEYATYNCDYPSGPGGCLGSVTNIAPVGYASQGAGRWGQLDLVGEMREWSLDVAFGTYGCTDCADTTPDGEGAGLYMTLGGSDFVIQAAGLPSALIGGFASSTIRDNGIGSRCARAP